MLTYVKELLRAGAPKVDLMINTNEAMYQEVVSGSFHIKGGRKKLKLKRLECSLIKEYQDGYEEKVETVTTILMSKFLHEKEDLIVPFTFQLSTKIEPSTPGFTYKFHTNLFFADNKVREDYDELIIKE
ncbi:sporulation protein [Niallia nealsonii]|uniref:Sporulation protein n=1 Tax=Niallia nealsonii TaxID=115979 RepID=A0A2N0Z405_9BACI|nr:sporulation protein [Niallia nealsonii]PKG24251.1 sporulation protein [Niallia nealsonii]